MKTYECENCLKVFKQKIDYTRHLNRKYPCKKVIDESKNGIENPKMDSNIKVKSRDCQHCLKTYSSVSNLNKHIKRCKVKKENNMKDELFNLLILKQDQNSKLLEEQKQQIELLQNKLSTVTTIKTQNNTQNNTNNITQNNTQNIKILAYDKTDSSHITQKQWEKIMKKCSKCIIELFKKLHYDPLKPENMNIYNNNIKNNYLMQWNGERWDIVPEKETLKDIVEKSEEMIDFKIGEWETDNVKYYEKASIKFNKYMNSIFYDKHTKEILQKLKLLMYNNRIKQFKKEL